jgi:hypothetical protein
MGLLSKALSFGGKLIGAGLNHVTGGAAGVLGNKALDMASKHAGVIGKVAGAIGKHVLSDDTRSKLSKFAEKAIDVLPESKLKSTLSTINSSARGKATNYNSSSSTINPGTNTYGRFTKSIRNQGDSIIPKRVENPTTISPGMSHRRGRGR